MLARTNEGMKMPDRSDCALRSKPTLLNAPFHGLNSNPEDFVSNCAFAKNGCFIRDSFTRNALYRM